MTLVKLQFYVGFLTHVFAIFQMSP